MSALLSSGADWYLMRGTGTVSLLLLTLVVALGIASVNRFGPGRLPRFVTTALHRSVSLLSVVFLTVHVVTAVLDPYAAVTALSIVVPFAPSRYPVWLGLGALGLDLIAALVVTSLLRRHLPPRLWRGVHWLAYAAWPVALLHGAGIGSDSAAAWLIAIDVACAGLVALALAWRIRVRLLAPPPAKHLAARPEVLPGRSPARRTRAEVAA